MQNNVIKILRIDASARTKKSHSRALTDKIADRLLSIYPGSALTERNLNDGLVFLSETMVEAMLTDPASRDLQQAGLLTFSDNLVKELKSTDILVLGIPMYNFSIPASLKAYIDLVTRSGLTFKYSPEGFKGLVENVRAYIVVTSDGIPLYSNLDYVSGYMKQILGFIGISEIQFIDATQIMHAGVNETLSKANAAIELIS